jgi:hypothetical protein
MQARAAKSLTTKSEYDVIQKATPTHIGKLTPAQLRKGLAAARRLRKKATDLAARQTREARGKGKVRGRRPAAPGENTGKKIELFTQAMERYAAALNKADESAAKEPRTTKKRPTPAAKRRTHRQKTKKETRSMAAGAAPAPRSKSEPRKKRGGKKLGKKAGKKAARKMKRESSVAEAASPEHIPATPALPSSARSRKPASMLFAAGAAPMGFDGMTRGAGGSLGAVESRNTALRTRSKRAKPSRRANMLAATPNARIRGHMSAATRRAQAKRDSK